MSVPATARHRVGPDSLGAVVQELVGEHTDPARPRVLLVTGRSSFEACGAADQLTGLDEIADVRRWSDISPNTDSTELFDGLAVMAGFDPHIVVGVGGGSIMDMAKLLCALEPTDTRDALEESIRTASIRPERDRRLILSPTTSGSGSEATHFAVVYIGEDKFSIAGPALRPDAVALVPEFTISGSPHQRATSGMDAMCQALESSWAVGATRRSRRYAEFAMAIIPRELPAFVAGDDSRASAMQMGSHLAGRAIDISKTTAAHALSYGITKRYGVDHGSAVSLTLGAFIDAHDPHASPSLQPGVDADAHASAMKTIATRLDPEGRSSSSGAAFVDLLDRVDLPTSLDQIEGFEASHIADLVASINVERLGNNPAAFTIEGLREVVEASRTLGLHRGS